MPRRHVLSLVAIGAYVVVLGCVAAWRTPIDQSADGILNASLGLFQRLGAPSWVNYRFVETSSNVLLFVPFGMLAMTYLRQNALAALLAGCAVSTSIEFYQAVASPYRFATVADVAANTCGAAIGVAIILLGRTVRPGTPRSTLDDRSALNL